FFCFLIKNKSPCPYFFSDTNGCKVPHRALLFMQQSHFFLVLLSLTNRFLMNYLDFEKPVAELIELRDKMIHTSEKNGVDVSKSLAEVEEKIATKRKEIYGKLTPWQRVQVSRHPDRP